MFDEPHGPLHREGRGDEDDGEDARLQDVEVRADGGPRARWARMVNNAAKSPEKNISSLPSQIITPMANIGGRSWTIFSCFARLLGEIA